MHLKVISMKENLLCPEDYEKPECFRVGKA